MLESEQKVFQVNQPAHFDPSANPPVLPPVIS